MTLVCHKASCHQGKNNHLSQQDGMSSQIALSQDNQAQMISPSPADKPAFVPVMGGIQGQAIGKFCKALNAAVLLLFLLGIFLIRSVIITTSIAMVVCIVSLPGSSDPLFSSAVFLTPGALLLCWVLFLFIALSDLMVSSECFASRCTFALFPLPELLSTKSYPMPKPSLLSHFLHFEAAPTR